MPQQLLYPFCHTSLAPQNTCRCASAAALSSNRTADLLKCMAKLTAASLFPMGSTMPQDPHGGLGALLPGWDPAAGQLLSGAVSGQPIQWQGQQSSAGSQPPGLGAPLQSGCVPSCSRPVGQVWSRDTRLTTHVCASVTQTRAKIVSRVPCQAQKCPKTFGEIWRRLCRQRSAVDGGRFRCRRLQHGRDGRVCRERGRLHPTPARLPLHAGGGPARRPGMLMSIAPAAASSCCCPPVCQEKSLLHPTACMYALRVCAPPSSMVHMRCSRQRMQVKQLV